MKRLVLGATILAAVTVGPVQAQMPPAAEIAGGYQWVREADQVYPRGWFLSGAAGVSTGTEGRISIVGELSESRFDEPIAEDPLPLGQGFTGSQLAYLGGVRYGRRTGAVRPFVQVLAGGARISAAFEVEDIPLDVSLSTTVWAMQPGGGADFLISERVAVRLKADYRYLGGQSSAAADTEDISIGFDAFNAVRVGAGLVVAF